MRNRARYVGFTVLTYDGIEAEPTGSTTMNP